MSVLFCYYVISSEPEKSAVGGYRNVPPPHYATMQTENRRSNGHEGASGELDAQKSWQKWRVFAAELQVGMRKMEKDR